MKKKPAPRRQFVDTACPKCKTLYSLRYVGDICGDLSQGQREPCDGKLVTGAWADAVKEWHRAGYAVLPMAEIVGRYNVSAQRKCAQEMADVLMSGQPMAQGQRDLIAGFLLVYMDLIVHSLRALEKHELLNGPLSASDALRMH